jgi:thiamine biosynthesis lipoprotein
VRTGSAGQRSAAIISIALIAFLASACARQPEESRYRFTAMGTLVEVTIYDFPAESADKAAAEVESLFLELQDRWDPWKDGTLGQINSVISVGEDVTPDDDLGELLSRASRISRDSGGTFDPAVGALVKIWGFYDAGAIPDKPPSPETVQETLDRMLPLTRMWDDETRVLSGHPGATIDLGAFAKGEAVDRAIVLLQGLGVENAIVNAGGDLRAIGRHGSRPWKIGVREPRDPGVLAAIEVSGDESVFTSGDYERYFEYQGRRYHHVLDPRTGYPTQGVSSVTVIGTDAALADAACTALMVAGPQHWPTVASALGLERVMVVEENGAIQMSPQMRERVRLLRDEAPPVTLRDIP